MRFGWRGALGILLSVLLLAWTLRDVDFAGVWHELRGSHLLLFAASAAVATLQFPIRARKWRTILDPIEADIPFGPLWRSVAIGMFITNTVPARAGEIARAYALSRERRSVPFSAAFASI